MIKRILYLGLLLVAVNGWGADKTIYVNTDSPAGGNGTTNSTTPGDANRAYNSWAVADDAEDGLAGAGDTYTFYFTGSATSSDTTNVDINGWNDDAIIVCSIHPDQRNTTGIWNPNLYIKSCSGNTHAITVNENNVTIDGIQIAPTETNYEGYGIYPVVTNNLVVKNCILNGRQNPHADRTAIRCPASCRVENTVIYLFPRGVWAQGGTGNLTMFNVTLSSAAQFGFRESTYTGITVSSNCAIFNTGDDFNAVDYVSYCASDDLDGTNAVNISPGTEPDGWAAAFTDYLNWDFSVKNASSVLYNAGQTLSFITNDIIGTARPQVSLYDIGAFELLASGGTSTQRKSRVNIICE